MGKWMPSLIVALLLLVAHARASQAMAVSCSRTFSQQLVAFDRDGIPYPSVTIEPAGLPGAATHDFELGRGRRLRVVTNIADAPGRGLAEVAGIPNLRHDIAGRPSCRTHWFIEGVCELLAKGFAGQEKSPVRHRFLGIRKVGTVLADPRVRDQVFSWSQHGGYDLPLESDLYGASMLLLMAWTEQVGLRSLLDRLQRGPTDLHGSDLVALMKAHTGLNTDLIFERALQLGSRLRGGAYLVDGRIDSPGWGG